MTLAQVNMGFVSTLITHVPEYNVTTPRLVALGLCPIAPTLLLVACLRIYSLAARIVFSFASTSNGQLLPVPRNLKMGGKQTRLVLDVAQTWLTDPLPFSDRYCLGRDGRHVARSLESDPLRQVYDSDLELGKVGTGLYNLVDKGETIFGLVHQSHSRSRRNERVFPVGDEEIALPGRFQINGGAAIAPSLAVIGKVEPWQLDVLIPFCVL